MKRLFLPIALTLLVPCLFAAEPVKQKTDVLDLMKSGAVEYYVNPQSDFHDDPKDVWTLQPDGTLRVSGRAYGYMATKESFRDYHLVLEFKWGEKTWGRRENSARDNGLLVHARGPAGSFGNTYVPSVEAQIIEGGTGDILVLSAKLADGTELTTSATCETTLDTNKQPIWTKGAPRKAFTKGRINWQKRAATWADKKGFRGPDDVERPIGEWNRFEVIAQGDTLRYFLNGVLVNEAFDVSPSEGRVLLQSEGAEIFVRRYELWPLGQLEHETPATAAASSTTAKP
jgi:hypothetical protein